MTYDKMTGVTLDILQARLQALGLTLPLSDNIKLLAQPLTLGSFQLNNRIAIQPMEGCDGAPDASPGELTIRRYHRFAQSGAGLIWFEATTVVPEGRANPRQLMLTKDNVDHYKKLLDDMREASLKAYGYAPMIITQLTHSGRYSKPQGVPAPIAARHNAIYDQNKPLDESRIVTDEYLDTLPAYYAQAAKLVQQAGFDGVDIKACHGYLVSELLGAHTRPGKYGGSYENRTRLYLDAIRAAQAAVQGEFHIATRINGYDGLPFPWGFGTSEDAAEEDLAEPIRLIGTLHKELGVQLINLTIGNPYFNPHINRPYDDGPVPSPEHPLIGVARIVRCTQAIKAAVPGIMMMSSGNSYLRALAPHLAAGMLEGGHADLIGFGRQAFAYPTFARDLLTQGQMQPRACCLSCSKCSELMRGSTAGCPVRDSQVYAPLYTQLRKGVKS